MIPISSSVALLFLLALLWRRLRANPHRCPPGPKGLPLLGNLFDFPQTRQAAAYAKMGEKYGSMVYLTALGQRMLVLNDAQHAEELLDKRSKIYSNRPELMMAGHLVGWEEAPGLIQYNQTCVEYRRLLAQFMGTKGKVEALHDLFTTETHVYLRSVLSTPQDWVQHTKESVFVSPKLCLLADVFSLTGSIALMAAYGYKPSASNDRFIKLIGDAMNGFSETTVPYAFLVDLFPALRFVPSWFPGAGWKRKAKRYNKFVRDMLYEPANWLRQQMAAGTARPCFLLSQLEDNPPLDEKEEKILLWAAANGIYAGAADTILSLVEYFVLAITMHTWIQKKAQEEMDSVLGSGVLPTIADRPRLPYLEAVYHEAMRYFSLGPLGFAHTAAQDDIYEGYFIPKGTAVFANIRQFLRDPKTYKAPEVFNPDRFIDSKFHAAEKDPKHYVFGFGRRRCPGAFFAEASTWITCASLIAAFDIQPPVKEGRVIVPTGKMADGTISHPEPFDCRITPRPGLEAAIKMA